MDAKQPIWIYEAGPEVLILTRASDAMQHEKILYGLSLNTGQDEATIRKYLNRRAVASPLPSIDVWRDTANEIMRAVRDGESIDWSA